MTSKTETAKALFKHLGYLFGGMSLIIMSLFMLGYVIDELVQIFGLTTMPFLASLVPFLITLTGIAWGGYFIWKGAPGLAIVFDLTCELADRVALNKMSRKTKILIGDPPLLAGVVILAIVIFQTAIRSGFFSTGTTTFGIKASPLWPIGIGLFLFGLIVTHGIEPRRKE